MSAQMYLQTLNGPDAVWTLLSSLPSSRRELASVRIDGPYALDDAGGSRHSPSMQLLANCIPYEELSLGEESNRCKQNVNKHLLDESWDYLCLKWI